MPQDLRGREDHQWPALGVEDDQTRQPLLGQHPGRHQGIGVDIDGGKRLSQFSR